MKLWVTILAVLIGIAVVVGVMSDSRNTNAPGDTTVATAPDAPKTDDAEAATDTATDAAAEAPETVEAVTEAETTEVSPQEATPPQADAGPAEAIAGLHAVTVTDERHVAIGYAEDDDDSPFELRVELNRYGAAVRRISLSDYLKTVGKPDHYIVHDELKLESRDYAEWYAYAAKAVTVNGTRIPLETNDVWSAGDVETDEQTSTVAYTATIADASGEPVLKIIRRYTVTAGSYDLGLEQTLINLRDQPLEISWEQNLQGDLVNDSGYLGDRRQFVSGYFAPWWDPNKAGIYTGDAELMRSKLVGSTSRNVWPPHGLNPQAELAWVGSLNRYFAVVTHAALDENVTVTADVPALESIFPDIDQYVFADPTKAEPRDTDKLVILKAGTDKLSIPPSGQAELDLGIFAGPRKPELFAKAPYSVLHLDQTIVYSLGGMCAFCTFQWLAHGLLWLLKLFEGQVLVIGGMGIGVHDWGVAIILLVALVRLLLHPITKRAQINMMKMGKMMQAIQPEVEKLKKKYKDDQQKVNAEMMKLYREKGVNPANMLGCLPMFLQTPIWIALYAMLYYAIELRHEPALWGFFQWVSGGGWGFLADLSQADNFIRISENPIKLNLLFIHPSFQAINILPLLMAVVFYFQQKLTTPPAANEQQAQQQKIMKLVIFLFPIFLYSAPSGLTLYILASTAAGVVDSAIVRKHIREQEESGELFAQKPAKPGGLRDRIAKAVETKQQELQQQQQTQKQKQHKGGKQRKRR